MDDTLYVLVCEQLSDEIIEAHDDFIFRACRDFASNIENSIDFDVAQIVESILKKLVTQRVT